MNTTSTAGGLNIDQMLQNLQQPVPLVEEIQTPFSSTPENNIAVSSALSQSFSVDSLEKPLVVPDSSRETWIKESPKKRKFVLTPWLRMSVSAFLTALVLIVWWWVVSIQYPEETKGLMSALTWTFSNITNNTKKNMKPDGIIVMDGSEDKSHGVADEDTSYDLSTPLSDAMDDAVSSWSSENKAEELFDNVLSGSDETNNIDFSSWNTTISTTWINSSWTQTNTETPVSNYPWDFTFPTTQALPSVGEFQKELSDLSEQSQSAMTNLIGNNDASLAKMRVVYKNVQAISAELSNSQKVTQEKIEQYNQIKALYDSINK